MALEFTERVRRIPTYPAADGYAEEIAACLANHARGHAARGRLLEHARHGVRRSRHEHS